MIGLEAGPARVEIDAAAGGRIASLAVDGLELLVTSGDGPTSWGCFPMAPWAGRLRHGRFGFEGRAYAVPPDLPPHAIHGTVHTRPWQATRAGPATAELTVGLGPDWPFPGRATQRLHLDDGGLDLALEVAADDRPFPAACGWHPWFRRHLDRGGPVELRLDAGAMWARDVDGLPSGRLLRPPPPGPWDDCFGELAAPPQLVWPGALALTVASACPCTVVFTEPEHAVCVEPQTGPPDALNLGPVVVEPGAPLRAAARLAWTAA